MLVLVLLHSTGLASLLLLLHLLTRELLLLLVLIGTLLCRTPPAWLVYDVSFVVDIAMACNCKCRKRDSKMQSATTNAVTLL